LCITMGASSEEVYKQMAPELTEIITNPSASDMVREKAIDALAMSCFVGNPEETTTYSVLEFFQKIFKDEKMPKLPQTAALKAWTLLLTTLPNSYVHDVAFPDNISVIVEFLKHNDIDIRIAAGDAIALLFEVERNVEQDKFSFNQYSGFFDVDELVETLYVDDASRTHAKKDKQKQKSSFKLVRNSVENGEVPTITLSFKHQKVDFDSWHQIHQLNALRECLGEGLQIHFEKNDLLQDIFGIHLDKDGKKTQLSAVEKRMFQSPSSPLSKSRSVLKTKARKQREIISHEILENQEEET